MTKESEMEMFDRWTDTRDPQEYVRLGKILFPEATDQELAALFKESRAGYLKAFPAA